MRALGKDLVIREFSAGDYEALAAVHNASYPDYALSAGDWRHEDESLDEAIRRGRWLVEIGGRVVAYCQYYNAPWSFHPRKFWVEIVVHHDYRRHGIGSMLWIHIVGALDKLDPIVLRGNVREDWELERRFASRRGFSDSMRTEESRLDIAAFDPPRFEADVERASDEGIVIRDYDELAGDPDRDRKLHELDNAILRDVPSPDPTTPSSFEVFQKAVLAHPRFLPACNLVALDGERYVGLSNLWARERQGHLETGLTGVLREYRGRGIATALKVRALSAAKAQGYTSTLTWNEERNQGMLGINRRLGFVPAPAWIQVENVLDAEALAESGKEPA